MYFPIDISLSPVHMLMDSSVIYAHQLVTLVLGRARALQM